ncbi:sensor histidine kinase [Cohnella laeviribosi]|uniref:sensor histidine kinase n=1 Tax=Cohnella laeviribosi TaxID=380174 RepID=UPI00035C5AC0|nr:sensor histidine kinase [Cohnella laeviribosi]
MAFFSIRNKLFLVFIAISIIPITVVTFSSYRSYTNLVSKQTSLVASNTINNTMERIDTILQNIDRISITLQQQTSDPASSITIRDELKKLLAANDPYSPFLIRNRLKQIFENLILSYDYINGLYLFSPDGKSISYGIGTDLKVGYNPLGDDWYEQTIAKSGGLYIGNVDVKPFIINAKPSIMFSRAIYDLDSQQFLGVFMLDCSLDIFKGLDRDIIPNISSLYLANGEGKILFDASRKLIGQQLPDAIFRQVKAMRSDQAEFHEGGKLTLIQSFPSNDWKIIASISLAELYKEYGISKKIILYVSVSCAAIFILLSIVLSNLITKPIVELSRIMRKNKSQKFVTADKQLRRMDEIGILYNEYDKMMKDMDAFIRERYQNRILTLDAQMKALEAQINSHFLYNTLESINSIAEVEEVESIAVMTKALGDMFRYSIKTDSELVPISDELKHVDNYIAIQRIRYEDRIRFDKQIEAGIENAKMLKLLLQPLVENAIYHGLETKRGKGCVTIKGFARGDRIVFEVTDDGVGMTPEQAMELRKRLAEQPEFARIGERSRQSIGLKNVHSRIALYYGPEYGLSFESAQGAGTTVRIEIPAMA